MKLKVLCLILFFPAFLFCAKSLYAQTENTWPMAGANPQRTSWSPEEVRGPYTPLWYQTIEPYVPMYMQVIAGNNLIYVTTAKGVYAFNADAGGVAWVYPTSLPVANSPTISGNSLYISGQDHYLHSISANPNISTLPTDPVSGYKINNMVNFRFAAPNGFETNPLVINNVVYAGNRDGALYAINSTTGSLIWKYQTGGAIRFSPAVNPSGSVIYFASDDMHAYAVNASGTLLWQTPKLPGSGFQNFWPVYYTDPSNNKSWIIFTTGNNYRSLIGPGITWGDTFISTELREIFPNRAVDPVGILPGPLSQTAGLWASNTPTVNMSLSENTANGSTTAVTEYFETKPWRRTYMLFDANTGAEYTSDFDHDGKPEYPPILYQGTHSGTRYPPVVGIDKVLYQAGMLYSANYIGWGHLNGWQPGIPYVSIVSDDMNAVDEPQTYTAGGKLVYWDQMCDREAGAFDVTMPNLSFYTNYKNGVIPATEHSNTPNREWKMYDRNLENGLFPDYSFQYTDGGGEMTFGRNGTYGCHGHQNAPIPYRGKIFMVRGNSLLVFSNRNTTATRQPNAKTVNYSAPTPELPNKSELQSKLKVQIQNIITAGHLRNGYFAGGFGDDALKRYCGSDLQDYFHSPGDTLTTLSRALPYLDSTTQTQLKTYLSSEYNSFKPESVTNIGWQGTAREFTLMPNDNVSGFNSTGPSYSDYEFYAVGGGWNFNPTFMYSLWKYAQAINLTPAQAKTLFDGAKSKLETPFPDTKFLDMPHTLNAFIAGYYGYLGLEKLAGYPESATYRQTLNHLLDFRATNFSKDLPLYVENTTTLMQSYCRGFNVSRNFLYLTPELGQYLHDHALTKVQTAINEYQISAPYWFISKYGISTGESTTQNLYDSPALIAAKAWILKEPYEELVKYLDVPAFERGDLFYIDNLVAALEAPYSGGTPTSTPTVKPGDANGDGMVDGADYVIWLSHYNQNVSGPTNGDFNNSGVVDGADYVIWLINYGI